MKISPALPLALLGLPAAFAAGWWLKPAESPAAAAAGPRIRNQAGPLLGGPGTAQQTSAPLPEPGLPLQIKPLTSLQEILAILGTDGPSREGMTMGLLMMELLPRLMLTDVRTVQAMVEELLHSDAVEGEMRQMISIGLMLRWMTAQPDAAMSYSLAHPGLLGESEELNLMGLMYLAKSRPEAARAMVAQMPEDQREQVNRGLSLVEGLSDPARMLQDPVQSAALERRQVEELAARWMQSDPGAAMAWLDRLPADGRRADLTARMAAVRMKQDPAATLTWLGSLPEGPEKMASRNQVMELALTGVKDEAAFTAKLGTLPPDWHDALHLKWMSTNQEGNTAAAADQITAMLARNPALGAELVAGNASDQVAQAYATQGDFTGGSAWARGLPPGPAQEMAVNALVRQWTAKDPAAASGWVTQLPPGPTRDGAAASLIQQIRNEDPASALVWAQSLSDENLQRKHSQEVFKSWFERKPVEAAAAIQALPPEDQQRIFQK